MFFLYSLSIFYDYFGFNNLQGNYLPQAQCETSRGVQSRRKADRDQRQATAPYPEHPEKSVSNRHEHLSDTHPYHPHHKPSHRPQQTCL